MKVKGRLLSNPYSTRGISRVPCARCGKQSVHQWNCCALGNRWFGVCEECDQKLNQMCIRFFKNVAKPTGEG